MSDHLEKQYLLTGELAARLRVKAQTLRQWRVTGRGPAFFKLCGRVVYKVSDVEAWEAANRRDPGSRKNAS